jgi:hypothetical protein
LKKKTQKKKLKKKIKKENWNFFFEKTKIEKRKDEGK